MDKVYELVEFIEGMGPGGVFSWDRASRSGRGLYSNPEAAQSAAQDWHLAFYRGEASPIEWRLLVECGKESVWMAEYTIPSGPLEGLKARYVIEPRKVES